MEELVFSLGLKHLRISIQYAAILRKTKRIVESIQEGLRNINTKLVYLIKTKDTVQYMQFLLQFVPNQGDEKEKIIPNRLLCLDFSESECYSTFC